MRARTAPSSRQRALGLSLVEIMVGVAIGLIGIVAIFQAVAVWSKHTQTTSAGGDAQVAGTLALFNIERDVKQAGHGFGKAVASVLGCVVAAADTSPARAFNFGLRPVDITVGAGGAPDTVSILYGDSSFYGAEASFTDATADTKKLRRREAFKRGDIAVVAVNPGASAATANCQLVEINQDNDVDGYTVGHNATPYNSYYAPASSPVVTPRFNGASAPLSTSGTMYNLGPQPVLNVWSVQGNRILTRTDMIRAPDTPMQVAEGVVNLKAEYGVDADADGLIAPGEWTTVAPADWSRLLAIRVAVLVRSRQFERNADSSSSGVKAVTPTAANPFYFGDTTRKFLMPNINGDGTVYDDLTADPNNWRFYRYRVYERVIPLRNMLWGTTE
ncbi:MAG: PilW family protein [Caldimonas sp.]